jgi:hypothetical protein
LRSDNNISSSSVARAPEELEATPELTKTFAGRRRRRIPMRSDPRAGAGDATLRVTKGSDDGARETDNDKIWWATGFSYGSNSYTKCNKRCSLFFDFLLII